ncbi:aldehyde dehydrogenase family protein [Nocardioides sp. LHD-245]|uniref:aldehyde dehydrogenase family protein n=1 Tax=Nocardioides sp. LHD-245 TaxID=3051387 RepID=UPI0027DF094F|nr:aldehyde dehydrogenase family protein [Nocardioides sp. LHD-245]
MSATWSRDDALVGGHWIRPGAVLEVEDPATGAIVGSGARCGAAEVELAVAAARAAHGDWSALAPTARADHLDALVAELRARRDELVAMTVAEVGAPITVAATWHVDVSLDILASAARHARTHPFVQEHGKLVLHRRSAGVAALITPWNYPLYQLAAKAGSALAAGCTLVHKPSELTPLSAYAFAEAAVRAGLPAGVVNLVPGTGAEVGAPLVAHEQVDVVSFTGSTAVGRQVAASAVDHLARVTLELGGKSASIVCDDADLDGAVRWSVDACMLNSGQTCSAWTRLLVPADRLDEAVAIAAARADEMVVGDPTDPATELGPLISADQHARVAAVVAGAVARGARVATRVTDVPSGGHYLRPVVLGDLPVDDPASQREIFGPVLVVHPYVDDEDALRIANGTAYGLSGAVWSADRDRARRLAARFDAGQVFVNDADYDVEAPFGGWKHSGSGREFGVEGLLEFTELTVVHL